MSDMSIRLLQRQPTHCKCYPNATKVSLQTCVLIPRLHDQGLLSSTLAGMRRDTGAAILVT